MIKRTLYFGNEAYLNTQKEQLLVRFPGCKNYKHKIPIEDIGLLMLDNSRITITQTLLTKLLENNVAFINCNAQHMPIGMMLNLDGNHVQTERFMVQMGASTPLKKRLWQQTIKAKINNQAYLLQQQDIDVENMKYWASKVGSGDPENYEGRAAAYYWKNIFKHKIDKFKRGRFEEEPNNLLNYGYAILRAIVARGLVASGMLPTLGIHHRNKYNSYCLADDIMEPYRPFVDRLVLQILEEEQDIYTLSTTVKKQLLQIPVVDIRIGRKSSPLMVGLQQTTASLYACFEGKSRKIKYPEFGKHTTTKPI